jgi:dUTPase
MKGAAPVEKDLVVTKTKSKLEGGPSEVIPRSGLASKELLGDRPGPGR